MDVVNAANGFVRVRTAHDIVGDVALNGLMVLVIGFVSLVGPWSTIAITVNARKDIAFVVSRRFR